MKWTTTDIPDLSEKIAIVTGANSGIGYETARALIHRGAEVILACRNPTQGEAAVSRILAEEPRGSGRVELLDLGNIESVRTFCRAIRNSGITPDLLINNAGIMMPSFGSTKDGFELQIGINHLGHFALTGLLIDIMPDSDGTRVVTVSSLAHQSGRIDFGSFRIGGFGETRQYNALREYRQSKLANLMFALELDRRLRARGARIRSVGAHPGITYTRLIRHRPVFDVIARIIGTQAAHGALPTLYAATAQDVDGGWYYGPGGFHETRGHPSPARIMPQAIDRAVAERLWRVSEELTGVAFDV